MDMATIAWTQQTPTRTPSQQPATLTRGAFLTRGLAAAAAALSAGALAPTLSPAPVHAAPQPATTFTTVVRAEGPSHAPGGGMMWQAMLSQRANYSAGVKRGAGR